MRGEEKAAFGEITSARFATRDAGGTEVNGRDQMLVYAVPGWPEEDFTVSLRVLIREFPQKHIGQIFSAWTSSMDDPLRLVVDNGKLFARIEAGSVSSTPGATLELNQWHAIAAVKQKGKLRLYVDGKLIGSCAAPEINNTQARECALGGNPHYAGNEFLAARFADFRFYDRALGIEQLPGGNTGR